MIPDDATTVSTALSLADERLYAHKELLAEIRRGTAHEPLLRTLAEREPELRAHVADVSSLAVRVGQQLGLAPDELEELRLAAELHDVGKLAIPDVVLQKSGPLDPTEWGFIHSHTLIGQRILGAAPALRPVGAIVRSTHENWDGTGYPDGLAGEAIPLAARIIGVCDAYSAITSDRPYRDARTPAEAVAELRRCAGRQFDPQVVELLCTVLADEDEPATPLSRSARNDEGPGSLPALRGVLRPLVPRRRRRARRRARAGAARERRSRAAGRAPASGRAPCRSSRARRARTRSRSGAR